MKVILKELFCIEWEFGREIQLTADISYSVTAYIGPAETEQVEGFTITVCNFCYCHDKGLLIVQIRNHHKMISNLSNPDNFTNT